MLPRLSACALLLLAFCTLAVDAGGDKKVDPKKIDVKDTKVKKDDKREFNEKAALAGVIKSVNHTKKTFTLTAEKDKKDRMFGVTDDTDYFGPRGGDRNDTGLNDDCMAAGYGLKVVPSKDGKTALAVQFDVRKTEEKKVEPKKTEVKK